MKTEILLKSYDQCTGCAVCSLICPVKAISMVNETETGADYPVINDAICVNCQYCIKKCHQKQTIVPEQYDKKVYAARSMNTDLTKSASGGVFASLAKQFVLDGGIVCGAVLSRSDHGFECKHKLASCEEEILPMLGSKYVQSSISDALHSIKRILDNDPKIKVLFSGTGCQISALYNYLGRKPSNLYTVEIICHGVPTIKLFNKYISYIENKKNIKVIDFQFRIKKKDTRKAARITYVSKSGKIKNKIIEPFNSLYYFEFEKGSIFRDSCYKCQYSNENRIGNITIGDYWHFNEQEPLKSKNNKDFSESKGISCLIVNDLQGDELIAKYGLGIKRLDTTYEKVAKFNPHLLFSTNGNNIVAKNMMKNLEACYKQHTRRVVLNLPIYLFKKSIPLKIKKCIAGIFKS